METLAVLGLIFSGVVPQPRSTRHRGTTDLTLTSSDAAAPAAVGGAHPQEDAETLRWSGLMALLVLSVTHVLSLVLAATGDSLTQPTDIITSLISPLVFLILKIAGVIGVQQ